jgi:hypothetical protein
MSGCSGRSAPTSWPKNEPTGERPGGGDRFSSERKLSASSLAAFLSPPEFLGFPVVRRFTTWGQFDPDRICAVLVCRGEAVDDTEASLRFSQARQLLRSVGMDLVVAVPEGQEAPRRRWWRSTEPGGSDNE